MQAVVYEEPNRVSVRSVDDPTIEEPTDAIVRITTSGLCGSDLHMLQGRTSMEGGRTVGHEPMGVIEEVGPAVRSLHPGDRVVMPFNIACGFCFNCSRGYTNACLTCNPESAGAGYGYAGLGPYGGAQAELLRVPYVDVNALKLPGTPGDEHEDDFVLLADVFPTAYHAVDEADVGTGDSVAVYGAGPVGLLAAHSAVLRGASDVYVVDHVPDRLGLAERLGATPIDFSNGDPARQIRERRESDPAVTGRLRRGEDAMLGVMVGIDAVGYQANAIEDPGQERATQAVDQLAELVNPTGRINMIGVFMPGDPGAADPHAQHGVHRLPLGTIWNKGITMTGGQAVVKRHNWRLRDLIASGRAHPGAIVSQRVGLGGAPDAYRRFAEREAGYTKVVFKPAGA